MLKSAFHPLHSLFACHCLMLPNWFPSITHLFIGVLLNCIGLMWSDAGHSGHRGQPPAAGGLEILAGHEQHRADARSHHAAGHAGRRRLCPRWQSHGTCNCQSPRWKHKWVGRSRQKTSVRDCFLISTVSLITCNSLRKQGHRGKKMTVFHKCLNLGGTDNNTY